MLVNSVSALNNSYIRSNHNVKNTKVNSSVFTQEQPSFKNANYNEGCSAFNGLFFIPKSSKRRNNNEYVVVGCDNEQEGPKAKAEIHLLNLNDKSCQIIKDPKLRCMDPVIFGLFGDKYLLHARLSTLIQIDIDDKKIVKTFTIKEGFKGQLLAFLPNNEYIITDNEKQIDEKDKKGKPKQVNRYGLALFQIKY